MDAKVQLHRVIVETARRGVGVLLVSSELDEVLGLSHRTLVFRDGSIVAEFGRKGRHGSWSWAPPLVCSLLR